MASLEVFTASEVSQTINRKMPLGGQAGETVGAEARRGSGQASEARLSYCLHWLAAAVHPNSLDNGPPVERESAIMAPIYMFDRGPRSGSVRSCKLDSYEWINTSGVQCTWMSVFLKIWYQILKNIKKSEWVYSRLHIWVFYAAPPPHRILKRRFYSVLF